MKKLSAVVLAAGKGVRMRSSCPKILTMLSGKTLIDTLLDTLIKSRAFEEIVVVLSKDLIKMSSKFGEKDKSIRFCVQQKPAGTADALRSGLKGLRPSATDVFVTGADSVLIKVETIRALLKQHQKNSSSATVLSAFTNQPAGYGRIVRNKSGQVLRIAEETDLVDGEKGINEINSGIYCFSRNTLEEYLKRISPNKRKKEYYLTDIIGLLSDGKVSSVAASFEEVIGINCVKDLVRAQKIIQERINYAYMEKGIKIVDPENTYIQADVNIGKDTTIFPFTYIERGVKIGRGCQVGPFARLRKGVSLADNVTVGNFIELSRTSVGRNSLMKHFGYLGDCRIADRVNIGAGTVTANYNGKEKNITRIEKEAFIGCDSVLVAPVKIGAAAVTGAGSVVTRGKNVGPGKVVAGVPARIIKTKEKRSSR